MKLTSYDHSGRFGTELHFIKPFTGTRIRCLLDEREDIFLFSILCRQAYAQKLLYELDKPISRLYSFWKERPLKHSSKFGENRRLDEDTESYVGFFNCAYRVAELFIPYCVVFRAEDDVGHYIKSQIIDFEM